MKSCYTTEEAAALTAYSPLHLRRMCAKKKIAATKSLGFWRIPRAEVERLAGVGALEHGSEGARRFYGEVVRIEMSESDWARLTLVVRDIAEERKGRSG